MSTQSPTNTSARFTSHGVNSLAWAVWLIAMLMVTFWTFNPWYQLLQIIVVVLLWPGDALDERSAFLRLGFLLRMAITFALLGIVVNGLTIHYGNTTLLQLPTAIPVFGGNITLEAILYGLFNGLRVASILFAFALFSRVVNISQLLRYMPPALFELRLVLSIAFTLLPFTLRAYREIRETQALRGYRSRGIRDLLPLFSPLLANGMEHALALAEAMEARGYGGERDVQQTRQGQLFVLAGLVCLMTTLLGNVFWSLGNLLSWGLLIMAGLSMYIGFRRISTGTGYSRWQQANRWGWPEWCISLAAVGTVLMVLLINRTELVVDPYQVAALGWPPFNPWLAIVLLVGFATPLLFGPSEVRRD